jgi:nitroimidazol reductase NimA-like FMN-containing flavoprotein (pyridoxamine 5'-phosphate oxidase superfamily)
MKLTKAEIDFVAPARVARLSTVDANGVPHNVPVCPIFTGGSFYFGTEATAKKVKNIETNSNVALVFDDYSETWSHLRGIMIQGLAHVVGKQEFRVLRKKLYEKYLQYEDDAPLDEKDSVIIEVSPRNKFSWGF